MTPTIWATPNKNSQVVCSAIHRATGFPMKQIHEAGPYPGPSIVYGLLRGCSELIQRCEISATPYWHVDHGYFKRSAPEKFDGYYRITKNGLAAAQEVGASDVTRWAALGIELAPMRPEEGVVLVCPPTIAIAAHFNVKPMEWAVNAARKAKEDGMEVVMRLKSSAEPASEALARSRCVIAYNSNIAVDAMVAGICASQAYGPVQLHVGRADLCAFLANNQWKLDEITPEIFA